MTTRSRGTKTECARKSELGALQGRRDSELALELLQISERIVELDPADPHLHRLQRMGIVTASRHLGHLERRQIMSLKKRNLLKEATWALVLVAGTLPAQG